VVLNAKILNMNLAAKLKVIDAQAYMTQIKTLRKMVLFTLNSIFNFLCI